MAKASASQVAAALLVLSEREAARVELPPITPIPEGWTFIQWVDDLSDRGLKVDGRPFRLDNRPAMRWIYEQVPSTEDEAFRYVLVVMKCAQVGFTIFEMLAAIYLGLRFGPATVGMFLPDMNLANIKSSERFLPIARTIPSVKALMEKEGEGNVRFRRLGDAAYIFSWTSGRATTESIPMDILSFDEVQEMTLEQIEKTYERLSASEVRCMLMGSTANWPDADIDHWYKRGTMYQFHTECPECGSKKPLDDYFPECVKFDPDRDAWRYVCPNGHWIADPQCGEWVAQFPERDPGPEVGVPKSDRKQRIRSVHFPQFLSPTISAGEIIFAYNTATDMKNFYNRKLGKPYLDPSQVPVTLEHLNSCAEIGMAAGLVWKTRATGCYMGIDQMGNFNVVLIKERMPDGRQAVVHAEEIYSADPFARCDELMVSYGVHAAVVEINPNYNDAKRFANRHPGKVWICDSFKAMEEGMIKWGDERLNRSEKRTDEDARDRYTVKIDQFKCMQTSMARFTNTDPGSNEHKPLCLFPDPQGLVQEVLDKGVRQTTAVLPRAFHHFTKTALVVERDDETNAHKRVVKKIGIDPHFSYANLLCDVAWARAHGTSHFIFPESEMDKPDIRVAVEESLPGLPDGVLDLIQEVPDGRVCGRCISFKDGRCEDRDLSVKASDPECDIFEAAS